MLAEIVDTDRYPVDDPGGPVLSAVVTRVRDELAAVGCSVLPGFVRPDRHAVLREEGARIAPSAHYDVETVNVYNTAAEESRAPEHPARRTMERGNAFVARDLVPPDALVHRLYTAAAFQRFVADCFGLARLHELADPLSGLTLNVVRTGRSHPWHFDTNEFTVSMLTQAPASGGVFEYCPDIRSATDEHFADVRAVLDGATDRVRRLSLRPGDLQLFRGRYALHRVTPVGDGPERHSAIFAYSARPDVVGSVERTRQLFGRVTPAHLDAARRTVRVDRLLD